MCWARLEFPAPRFYSVSPERVFEFDGFALGRFQHDSFLVALRCFSEYPGWLATPRYVYLPQTPHLRSCGELLCILAAHFKPVARP